MSYEVQMRLDIGEYVNAWEAQYEREVEAQASLFEFILCLYEAGDDLVQEGEYKIVEVL